MTPTQKQALEAALSALESERIMAQDDQGNYTVEVTPKRILDAIEQVKAALAEPEQEPVASPSILRYHAILEWNRAQPDPPIAIPKEYWVAEQLKRFYPEPQPREWQELSEDQLAYAIESARCEAFPGGAPKTGLSRITYKHISAALRAKNGY
jgi:hypothetical protein